MASEARFGVDFELVEQTGEFLRAYYRDEIAAAAQNGDPAVYVEYGDLYTFNAALAEDLHTHPQAVITALNEGLDEVDLPIEIPSSLRVRVTDEDEWLDPIEVNQLTADHLEEFVAVRGQLNKVTGVTYRYTETVFHCDRCGAVTRVQQSNRLKLREPVECQGCERKGPFSIDVGESSLVDHVKIKLKEPPGRRARGAGEDVTVFAEEDLCHHGGENGLADHAGERVVLLGTYKARTDNTSTPETDGYLVAESVVFIEPTIEDITVDETREEFERLAAGDDGDPVELLKESITPRLETTKQLDVALEAAVGWLFNSYRIERPDGDHVRGDLHMGLIGDPSTGKSSLLSVLARIAPKAVYRSGGAISKVGLTAAAVQEEFAGKTEWTLEPGVLPRANGGHCLIDEVDEILDERSKAIHDALEGEQVVKVSKAGIHAELPTRAALLISGNPKEGRFDRYAPISDQLDMDPAFISRIDILLPMTDELKEERDRRIAETNVSSYRELSHAEVAERQGEDLPEPDETARPVPIRVFRDWVHYAREQIHPLLTDEAEEMLVETYLDARNLNDGYDTTFDADVIETESTGGDDVTIPVTIRVLEAAIRLSTAFARVELSETVEGRHVERSKHVLRHSIGLNFDREAGVFDVDRTSEALPKTQRDRRQAITDVVRDLEGTDPAETATVIERVMELTGADRGDVEHDIEKLKTRGEIYEPSVGALRAT